MTTPSLDRQVRELRSQLLVRSWEYRQRHHAHGVWFRFRRVLVDAKEAYAIPRPEAEALIANGSHAEPVGSELQPPKLIIFVPAERVRAIPTARSLEVRLSADLLQAECLALVPFEGVSR
ncbi:MAG TPA: hypothetical protein VJU18_03575 [Vicinamibacteria bacterium]|nr:hypothetical protein [Vicinamibacteria bacterium]